MTQTTHTPGPWHPTDSFVYANHDAQLPDVYNAGAAICIAKRCNLTRDADMQLIAAAPDLLAALQECITSEGAACFGDMDNHPEGMQRRLYAISDIAREAIRKAKGE